MSVSIPISSEELANTDKPRPSRFVEDVLPKAPASFFNLPRELQLLTFSFFPHKELCMTVAPVCQHWWQLSKDPSLWKSLDISVHTEDESTNLAFLLLQSPMLTKLKIRSQFYLEEFAVFAYACPLLKHLDLESCRHVDHRILALFVQNCPLLEELNFSGCEVNKMTVSSIVRFQHLRLLNLADCFWVDNECIQLISEQCKHLEDINLLNINGNFTEESISNLAENLHETLLRLELNGENLTDSTFLRISLCRKLQHLYVDECDRLTDKTLIYLKMLTDLKSLMLRGIYLMTSVALKNFFAGPHIHNLVKLELTASDIDDDGVYNITQNCKKLKKLKLTSCEITEVGVEHIVKYCKNLVQLKLSFLGPLVTGLCLLSIPENLSCLQELSLDDCEGIADSIFDELVSRVPELVWC